MYRYMTRENPALGMYFLCDKGRFDIDWLNENRLFSYYIKGLPRESKEVVPKILEKISKANKIGVIGGAHESNENLSLIKSEVTKWNKSFVLEARITEAQSKPVQQVDFLMTTDSHPNTKGAVDLGFTSPQNISGIVQEFNRGEIDLLFIIKEDLPQGLAGSGTVIVLNTNITTSVKDADYGIPIKTFAEQMGSFTNKNGIKQNFEMAMNPLLGLPSSGEFFKRLSLELSRKKEEATIGNH
jgi:NADH-quinone oxidoreductase subunit G